MTLNWESRTKKSPNVPDSDAYESHLIPRIEVQRRRLIAVTIIASLVHGIFLIVHVIVHGFDPSEYKLSTYAGQGLITSVVYGIIINTALVLALKRVAVPMVCRISFTLFAITLLFEVALTGGLNSYLAPFVIVGPVLGALVLSARDTIGYAVLYAAGIVIIAVLHDAGALPASALTGQSYFYSKVLVIICGTFAVAALAIIAIRQYENADERLRALLVQSEQLTQNLKAERERFADFSDVASDWLFEVDTFGIVTYSAGRYMTSLSTGSERVVGTHYREIVEITGSGRDAIGAAIEQTTSFEVEHAISRLEGEPISDFRLSGKPFFDQFGVLQGYRGVAEDVTQRIALRKQRDAISDELDHRVKNLLAVISATASIAGQSATSLPNFVEDFNARLRSIDRTYRRLNESDWTGLPLHTLLDQELKQFSSLSSRSYTFDGPKIKLSTKATKDAALLIHEMATNAAKHGCFSVEGGHLDISWVINEESFEFRWIETGLTGLLPPERTGFGTALFEMMPNIKLSREFAPTGVIIDLSIPVQTVMGVTDFRS